VRGGACWKGVGGAELAINNVMEPSYSLNILDLNGAARTVENIMWDTTARELLNR